MRRLLLVLVVVAAAGACSGSSANPRPVYVDAASSAFTSGKGGPPLPAELAECVGEALVDLPGAEALRDAGVNGQELADAPDLASLEVELPDEPEAQLADDLGDCGLGPAIEKLLLDAALADADVTLSADARACVLDASDDAEVEAGLAATFVDRTNGTPGFDTVVEAIDACPDAVAELGQPPADAGAAA
jgi:hypothetical protein